MVRAVACFTYALDGVVITAGSLANGELLIGGRFWQMERNIVPALAVGDVDGTGWAAPSVGGVAGLQGSFAAPEVRSIVKMADGRHLIGGAFTVVTSAGAPLGTDVVIFDAQGSVPFSNFGPSPFLGGVNAVLEHSDGTVFSGGNGVYRRDGSTWTQLSTVANGLGVNCLTLAELPNGDVVVGGDLQLIPGPGRPGVMRWDGGAWQPIGTGLAGVAPAGNLVVTASIVRDDGVLFVVGTAGTTSFAASFDGTWQLLPGPVSGTLRSLELLPNGDLVVGGEFDSIAGVAAASVARFDGSSWQAIGDGVRQLDGQPGTVFGLHFSNAGDLLITGEFSRHDGEISVNFTRVRSLCPSLSQSFAAGCVGSGGQNVLRSESGAWLGGTMRGVATGLASNGLAVNVLGLATAFAPLPGSSCTAWVRPDYLELLVPVAGQASTELAIPASSSLIGLVLHQQVVGVEIVGGSIAALTSSNRLQHTIGVF